MEIQLNVGAIVDDNIDFTKSLVEKEVSVDSIFLKMRTSMSLKLSREMDTRVSPLVRETFALYARRTEIST